MRLPYTLGDITGFPETCRGIDEIRRSADGRFVQRAAAVRIVAIGYLYFEAAEFLCETPSTVAYWVRRYRKKGVAALQVEQPPGTRLRLTDRQLSQTALVLHRPPQEAGLKSAHWDAKILGAWIAKKYSIRLGARHCGTLLRQLGAV
jgi:transposase